MTFYTVEKSKRRWLVMIERTTSHTAGHTMQSLEVLCETDSPQIVTWLLSGLDDQHSPLFARQLLEEAALSGSAEAILSKNIPPALYCTSCHVSEIRRLWDELKGAIGQYSLASVWNWAESDHEAARDLEAAFAAFHAAREGRS